MALFLVELELTEDPGPRGRLRPNHRAWVNDLAGQGVVVAAGPWSEGIGGAMLFNATDEDEVRRILRDDPYHRESAVTGTKVKGWDILYGTWARLSPTADQVEAGG
jgi:hypothetical protein